MAVMGRMALRGQLRLLPGWSVMSMNACFGFLCINCTRNPQQMEQVELVLKLAFQAHGNIVVSYPKAKANEQSALQNLELTSRISDCFCFFSLAQRFSL